MKKSAFESGTDESTADGQTGEQGAEAVNATLQDGGESAKKSTAPIVILVICVIALFACSTGIILWKKRK